MTDAESVPVFLDAVLHPHRSLPPRGFAWLMAGLGTIGCGGGVLCVLAGAWPVTGFFGLDILLLYIAFRASYRSARQSEAVRLTGRSLVVERQSQHGERRRWQFEPFWTRIVFIEEDEHRNTLRIASHGRTLTLGSFLGPAERRNFAGHLQAALTRWRAWIGPAQ